MYFRNARQETASCWLAILALAFALFLALNLQPAVG